MAGNGKTLMVVNAAPEEGNAGETLCSLQFAARVRGVELGAAKRTVDSGSEINELTEELARLRSQVVCHLRHSSPCCPPHLTEAG